MITARSQSMEIKNLLQQTTADLSIFRNKLQTLLNTDAELSLADTVLRRSGSISSAENMVTDANPSLGFMKQQSEVSRIEKNLERSRLMPDLSVGYFQPNHTGNSGS